MFQIKTGKEIVHFSCFRKANAFLVGARSTPSQRSLERFNKSITFVAYSYVSNVITRLIAIRYMFFDLKHNG